eukprot:TRINITY_DN688_c0_g1_i2.p1 TRINITY_DN688_c0_g1~~TRINITY_DN688_c0_g1_i2.p1  ORF type:complete len:235 (-),score=2.09 TRINITY_DN688_c0_g1_i2:253-957(-)
MLAYPKRYQCQSFDPTQATAVVGQVAQGSPQAQPPGNCTPVCYPHASMWEYTDRVCSTVCATKTKGKLIMGIQWDIECNLNKLVRCEGLGFDAVKNNTAARCVTSTRSEFRKACTVGVGGCLTRHPNPPADTEVAPTVYTYLPAGGKGKGGKGQGGKGKGGKGKGKRGKGKHGKGKGRRYRVEPRVQYLDFSWYSPSVPAVLPDPTRRTVIASSQMLEYMNNVQDVCASLIASS